MRALRFDQFGDPSVLHVDELREPGAGGDTALVEVRAASVNPSDVKNVAGRMAQTIPPRTPGRDYAGVVVRGPAPWLGAEVWGTGGDVGFTRDGTHAALLAVPVASLRRKPRVLSHAQAASVGVNYMAAWCGVMQAARLRPSETIVIIGLGGVGGAAAQIARRHGGRVIGVDRTGPLPGSPAAGAVHHLITPADGDLAVCVRALTEGAGAAVVFDTVGGSMFATALGLVAVRGRLIEIAATDQRVVSFDLADFYHNETRLIGVDTLKLDLTASAEVMELLAGGFEDGSYQAPVIAASYRLEEARAAYEAVARGTQGRVVLTPAA